MIIQLDRMIEESRADDSVKTVMKLLVAALNKSVDSRIAARELYVPGSDGNWYKLEVNLSTLTASFTSVGKQIPTGA